MKTDYPIGLQVRPWPISSGGRRSDWWILDYAPGRGFSPVHGPYRRRMDADARLELLQREAADWPIFRVVNGRRYKIVAVLPDNAEGTEAANVICGLSRGYAVLATVNGEILVAHANDAGESIR